MSDSQAQLFQDKHPLIRSCRALNKLRVKEELTDLTIEVQDGARLHAHKVILAARIPALRAPANDRLRSNTSVIRWPTVPLSIATSLIEYAYTGELKITQENVIGVVALARIMQLPAIKSWGKKLFASNLNREQIATTWVMAKFLNSRSLMDACVRHMAVHFEGYVYSDFFVRLPADFVLSVLRSESLLVSSEEQVFSAVSRWATFCNEAGDRKMNGQLPAMLEEIQWDQTSAQFRGRLLDSHPIFWNSTECSIFAVRGARSDLQLGITSVEEFVVRERRWRPRAPLTCRRQQHAAAVVWVAAADGCQEGTEKALIGVFGGSYREGDTPTCLASCELYEVSQNRSGHA
ncbi:unnamed protein product [Dibothriocephalus latus]|uniref:BTB domain-containing protein n=1 Tax=Dibothriocephalus latus TaxID=60516 RepID=A0A3P7NKF2_DIBLA|nr:unnamed protein product [Dibothriocephalus latus]